MTKAELTTSTKAVTAGIHESGDHAVAELDAIIADHGEHAALAAEIREVWVDFKALADDLDYGVGAIAATLRSA